MIDTALATEIRDLLRRLLRECEIIAEELHRADSRQTGQAQPQPQPPLVCAGSGLVRTASGACPICDVSVDAVIGVPYALCAPHPYPVFVNAPKEADDAEG